MNPLEHRNYLHDLSLRLVRLSGNERIRKRIPGAGGGDAFNVLDEVPQFALDQLLAGKVLELTPYPNIEEVLKDEKTQEFEDAFNELREMEGRDRTWRKWNHMEGIGMQTKATEGNGKKMDGNGEKFNKIEGNRMRRKEME